MTFTILILIPFIAAILAARKWRRTAAATLLFGLVLFFAIGSGPLTTILLKDIQSGYNSYTEAPVRWGKNSLIILLGMDTANSESGEHEVGPLSYGRVAQALEAYRACKVAGGSCRMLISGGDKLKKGVIEAKVYADQLALLGVDPADMLLETASVNTWENARFSRPIIDKLQPDKIYLVTSGVHMRRAMLYFGHFGIHPVPLRSDYLMPWPTVLPMAYNITLADLALSEYRGLLRYEVYNSLGKNPPPLPAYKPPSYAPVASSTKDKPSL